MQLSMQVSFRYFKGHKGCISRERNASVNNKCTFSSHKISSSGVFLVASWFSIIDRHWRRSSSRCFTVCTMIVSEDRSQRISVFVRMKDWIVGGARCSRQEQQDTIFFLLIALFLESSRAFQSVPYGMARLGDWSRSSYDHRTVSISAISVLVVSSSGILW